MTKRFFIHDLGGRTVFGKNLKTGEASIEPGHVVKLESSGSTVALCDAADSPLGIAYGERHGVYTPTSRVFASGEACNVVWGNFLASLTVDFFSSGSIPTTSPTLLYTAASGLIGTSSDGTTKIGQYLRTETLNQPLGGTGSTQSLALCRFNFQP